MITRQEYMADTKLFWPYYLEIALEARISIPFKLDIVRKALADGDEYLNTLRLDIWDATATMQQSMVRPVLKKHGDNGWSLSSGVCALKALARYQAALNDRQEAQLD